MTLSPRLPEEFPGGKWTSVALQARNSGDFDTAERVELETPNARPRKKLMKESDIM